jgi:hypothetical protein
VHGWPLLLLDYHFYLQRTVLSTFMLTKVVPNICKRLPDSSSLVFGKAVLLWLVFSSVANNFLSQAFINEGKGSLNDIEVAIILNEQHSILKMPLLVSGADGTVFIDELADDKDLLFLKPLQEEPMLMLLLEVMTEVRSWSCRRRHGATTTLTTTSASKRPDFG